MKSIEVMKQENEYTLKMVSRLQEISLNAHEMRRIKENELENCIEFIQLYIIEYHQYKQEHILFEEIKYIMGKEVRPLINELLQIQGIEETYFSQLKEAYTQYKKGKYLAIYNIINNAYTYGVIAKKRIEKEEKVYGYIMSRLSQEDKRLIDTKIAYFHKQIEKVERIESL